MFAIVLPFHRDVQRLDRTIDLLVAERDRWQIEQALFCHNGRPLAPDVWSALEAKISRHAGFALLHTDTPGMGAGYRLGIQQAGAAYVVLSASDLPFGFSDIASFLEARAAGADLRLAVGSKLHPRSHVANYGLIRRFATYGFLAYRWTLFGGGLPKDTQGTLLIERELARSVAAEVQSNDYFFSFEFLARCRSSGIAAVEVPVTFVPNEADDLSSVSVIRQSWTMGLQTLRLRRQLREMK